MMMRATIILDPGITKYTAGKALARFRHPRDGSRHRSGVLDRSNALVDTVCLQGLRYLHDGLLRTRESPDDEAARNQLPVGFLMSAFGLQARVPMGASHAIGHVLGGTCDVPHYFCTAVMMPSVLRYNRSATEQAQKQISAALDAPELDASEAFAAFIAKLGLPRRLADVGVHEDRFELIGNNAMLSIFTRSNPQPIRGPGDVVEITEARGLTRRSIGPRSSR